MFAYQDSSPLYYRIVNTQYSQQTVKSNMKTWKSRRLCVRYYHSAVHLCKCSHAGVCVLKIRQTQQHHSHRCAVQITNISS